MDRTSTRLLEPLGPGEELATARTIQAHLALFRTRDPVRGLEEARTAAEIAGRANASAVELVASALEGLALTSLGDVAKGTDLLDEASIALVSGELTNDLDRSRRGVLRGAGASAGVPRRDRGRRVQPDGEAREDDRGRDAEPRDGEG